MLNNQNTPSQEAGSLKISFIGGTEMVTGSNFMLSETGASGQKFLIDCGLNQGTKAEEKKNYEPFAYDPATIDALFITHAHLDHVGLIPKLVKAGFRGPIYSTPPTKDIAHISLEDSLSMLEREAQDHSQAPLFNEDDVKQAMSQWKTFGYHDPIQIGDFTVIFRDSGHILGSAMIEFNYHQKKVVFTGDLGNSPSPLLPDTEVVSDADYLVMESVYGDRNHEDRAERRQKLEDVIEETMRRGGTLMIPAFSIERTQELLYEIENMMENSRIPLAPVFLDSPMAIAVTKVYKDYPEYFNKEATKIRLAGDGLFRFAQLHITQSTPESKAIFDSAPRKIIIAGSGMSNGGRIIHHEKNYLPDTKSTLLLAGYQGVGTLGRIIQDGTNPVRILGEEVPVRAHLENIHGYSAHKDSDHLLEFVKGTSDTVKKVFVCMGEPKASLFLTQRIRDYLGLDAVVPKAGETIEIRL